MNKWLLKLDNRLIVEVEDEGRLPKGDKDQNKMTTIKVRHPVQQLSST